jgi:glycosyltransferase involved in cell wall biosynthesis
MSALPLSIVLVQNQFPHDTHWGGISTYGWFMAQALAKEGVIVHVICQSADNKTEDPKQISDFIHVYRIPGTEPISGNIKKLINKIITDKSYWFAHNAWVHFKELQKKGLKADVIDCADYLGSAFFFLKDDSIKVPINVTCHTPSFIADEMNEGEEAKANKKYKKRYEMEIESIKHAFGLLSPSHRLSKLLAAKTGRSLNDFFTNPYPYPVQQEVQTEPEMVNVKRPFVLFTGRIERRKGIQTLIKAWNETSVKKDYSLVFAGKKTNHSPEFESLIDQLSIPSLQFVGEQNREQLAWLYQNAALVILPSQPFENYPYTCIESMGYAAPTLVSDSGGMSELVYDEENGWVFKTGSVEHLTEQIEIILNLPVSDKIAIGLKAQQTIKRINAPNRIAQRTINYYNRLIDDYKKS